MLLLKQQLLKKAKIINEYRHPTKQSKLLTLQKLKKIKKQLKSTQKQTQKVSQTVFAQRVTQSSYTQQLYFMTFTIMKAFDKQFQFLPEEKDIYKNFIQMNINFYRKQEAFSKSEEISRTYRKKLLQKNMIFPTLLSWLFEWTRKRFEIFLKQNIKSLERDLIVDQNMESTALHNKKQKSPLYSVYFSEFELNSSLKLKKFDIFMSEKCNQQKLKETGSIITLNKFQHKLCQLPMSQLSQNKPLYLQNINPLETANFKLVAQIFDENDKNIVPFKNYSRLSITNLQQEKEKSSQLYINKQAFYGCFYQQFKKYYKKLNCIQDIDHYYLKTIRKNTSNKKQMIQQRMQDMIQALMKNQSEAIESIKKYYDSYSQRFPQFKKRENKKKDQDKLEKQIKNTQILKNYSFNKRYSLPKTKFLKSQASIQERTQSMASQKIYQHYKMSHIDLLQGQQNHLRKNIELKGQKLKQLQSIKLPVVSNPEDINKPFQSVKESKKQKNRNLKGLIRYKFVNKTKQPYSSCDQTKFQLQKSQQFQLGNIRKILKQRLLRRKQQQNVFCNSSLNIQTDSSQKANVAKIDFHLTKNGRNLRSKPTEINLKQMCANISSIHEQMNSNYFQLKTNCRLNLLPQIQKGTS